MCEWIIKFIGLSSDRWHRGPLNPHKPCNHNLYIGFIFFPHIYDIQSTGHNYPKKKSIKKQTQNVSKSTCNCKLPVYTTASTWETLIRIWTTCCPASRTTLVARRFRVAVICPIIQVPHCIRVFFYFVWFVFINHIFQFYYELCTYCNILDIYLS